MRFKTLAFLALTFLASCTLNVYRPLDNNVINLREKELEYRFKEENSADLSLTLRKGDCQVGSLDYLIVIEKIGDKTISKAFSNYGEYPETPSLPSFDWNIILDSLDQIKNQKEQAAYHANVIEGDTTWYERGSISGEPYWVFKLYTPERTVEWEFNYELKFSNPSLTRVRVSDYIFQQSYRRLFNVNSIYGELKEKKLPLIERRRRYQ